MLDEPTSGLDTYARRHLWNLIKKFKKDRIIILTTHNMDEAEFLGDRIGVMS
jgi:ATP-binding cassette subfamily A (ABC1) protein 3